MSNDKLNNIVGAGYVKFRNCKPSIGDCRRHLMTKIALIVPESIVRRTYANWPLTVRMDELVAMERYVAIEDRLGAHEESDELQDINCPIVNNETPISNG